MSFLMKYAPKHLSEVVISDEKVRTRLDSYVTGNNRQPLLLYGSPGVGKSSIASLLPDAIEGKKADVRNLITTSFTTVNEVKQVFNGGSTLWYEFMGQSRNYLISDEFNVTRNASLALRQEMDFFQINTQMIFTTNYIDTVDEAIQDRCLCLEIKTADATAWLPRAQYILESESIVTDAEVLKKVIESQLMVSRSHRKLLEQLEIFVNGKRNAIKSANKFRSI